MIKNRNTVFFVVLFCLLFVVVCPHADAENQSVVRLIYFLPNDRAAQENIDADIIEVVTYVQQFYADQMQHHGYGRKTFALETDADGNAFVHHVVGKFEDAYYHEDTVNKSFTEIKEHFDPPWRNAAVIIVDTSKANFCGLGGGDAKVFINCFNEWGRFVVAHELGHAFGLQHDFRDDINVMSYGGRTEYISKCAAEWLDVSRFFNTGELRPVGALNVNMLPPIAYPENAISIRFDITFDTDHLIHQPPLNIPVYPIHQVQLHIPVTENDPAPGIKLYGCKLLGVKSKRVEFFLPDAELVVGNRVNLMLINTVGSPTARTYEIKSDNIATIQPDVDGNGVVNILDLVRVAAAFDQNYDSEADVNHDGVVNVNDLILIANAMNGLLGNM